MKRRICPICKKPVSTYKESWAAPEEYGYKVCHFRCVHKRSDKEKNN